MPLPKGSFDVTKEEVQRAIEASRSGLLTDIAQRLGVSRSALSKYLKYWPDLEELRQQKRESFIDLAEDKLMGLVKNGDRKAIFFTLERLGKNRGYYRQEERNVTQRVVMDVTYTDDAPKTVVEVDDDNR